MTTTSLYTGQKFGRLLIISEPYPQQRKGYIEKMVICKCECGNIKNYSLRSLKRANTKSCGCLHNELITLLSYKHGQAHNSISTVWKNMKTRCLNPTNKAYKSYGGRGIMICDEWINNASAFIEWAFSNGYKPELRLDRKDNNGNYSPENCRFISVKQSMRNTRRNKFFTYRGETKSLAEWVELLNLKYQRVADRIRLGWDFEKAINTPVKKAA